MTIVERRYQRPSDPAVPVEGPLAGCPVQIATLIAYIEDGDSIGNRYFDAGGREVTDEGEPMPARPPNLPPTSFYIGRGWCWTRRRGDQWIEAREFREDGSLRKERDHRTNRERGYYPDGVLHYEGQRDPTASGFASGTWHYYDRTGRRYLSIRHDETCPSRRECWRRWEREDGASREGPIEGFGEAGVWVVRDPSGAVTELDLGIRLTDEQLLAHVATADELDETYRPAANDRSFPAMIARARRAGVARDPHLLGLDNGPGWYDVDDEGRPKQPARPAMSYTLIGPLESLRWLPPDPGLLATIASTLFNAGRVGAALDIIDAALAIRPDEAFTRTRAEYLCALGTDEAALAPAPRVD